MNDLNLISIVTPTFNERENIEKLCFSISEQMKKNNYKYEHIIIDNCSTDGTISILKKLAEKDKNLKIIINSRNYGHIKSPIYGLYQATGKAIILIAADFQDPVELIPKYIDEWKKGFDVVLAKKNKSNESFLLHNLKKFFYVVIDLFSETKLTRDTTGSGLFDRKIIDIIKKVDDPYPYFRGLISEVTSNIKLIDFNQPKRQFGETKNNLYTLYDLGILGIVNHTKVPLRIVTLFGFVSSLGSLFVSIFFLFKKLYNWDTYDAGIAPLIIGLFFIASIQIFLLGFIGEYVMNLLTHVRKLPLVIEKERINF